MAPISGGDVVADPVLFEEQPDLGLATAQLVGAETVVVFGQVAPVRSNVAVAVDEFVDRGGSRSVAPEGTIGGRGRTHERWAGGVLVHVVTDAA